MRKRITDIRHLRVIGLLVIIFEVFILSDDTLCILFHLLWCDNKLLLLNYFNILLLWLLLIISSCVRCISLLLTPFRSLRSVFGDLFLPLLLLLPFFLELLLFDKFIFYLLRLFFTLIPYWLQISIGLLVMLATVFLGQSERGLLISI